MARKARVTLGPYAMPRARRLELPSLIGPYMVVRELGSGGMGTVYCGVQHCPEREVAVKVLAAAALPGDDDGMRARFLNEREIAGRFEHPNIIRVYDAGEELDGQLYYVMEYARRGTLADFVRAARLSHTHAVRMLVDVAFAVDYAHRMGVLHRDLKPTSILLGDDLRPRVADFGAAEPLAMRTEQRLRSAGVRAGSLPYTPPEQVGYCPQPSAAQAVSRASDVYSLGAILYELLQGRPPYAARTSDELWNAFAAGPPPTLRKSRVGHELEAVVFTALEHDPDRRYPSAAAFAEDLRRTLAGHRTVERPRSWRGRLRCWLQRHGSWMSLGVGVWLLVAGIAAALNQELLRESVRQQQRAQREATHAAAVLRERFEQLAQQTQLLASDARAERWLSEEQPSREHNSWLQERVPVSHTAIRGAALVAPSGDVISHLPSAAWRYAAQASAYHRRVYFSGLPASDQGLGKGVVVAPLFHDAPLELVVSAPVYSQSAHRLLGIVVVAASLAELARALPQPELPWLVPLEAPSLGHGKLAFDPAGVPHFSALSEVAESLYVARLARSGYAIMADIAAPPPRDTSMSVWFWILVTGSAFGLASRLFSRSAVRES